MASERSELKRNAVMRPHEAKMLRSRYWLSSVIRRDKDVGTALAEISARIHTYADVGSPARDGTAQAFSRHLAVSLVRPRFRHFLLVVIAFAVAGGMYAWASENLDLSILTDLVLKAAIPVFVLGIPLVSLTRSLSEAGRFTAEYLNDACKMPLFCCLTFLAALLACATGALMATGVPRIVTACVAGASVGATIACLVMLAFVVRETMLSLMPSQSVRVVSRYAARKLCYAYLKEVYANLVTSQEKAYLEKWCVEQCKAIHPPSQYFGHFFKSRTAKAEENSDATIRLITRRSQEGSCKDFHLERLTKLDEYLRKNGAELYLSPSEFESERTVLGSLSYRDGAPSEAIKTRVHVLGNQAVRLRRPPFEEESDDFWDSQHSALNEAVERAISKADPLQVRAYLDAVNEPLTVLRQVRCLRVVREIYGQSVMRGHVLLGLYLTALEEILASVESGAEYRRRQAFTLARTLLISIWEETKDILKAVDYHTMELFTWLVPQIYRTIQDAGNKAEPLWDMRAQFGGFYTFAEDWLEDNTSASAEDIEKMRCVLHDGLTKWLLMVLERPEEGELIKQLCDAARGLVFPSDEIRFDRGVLVARQFVLAGYLMQRSQAKEVNAGAVEHLFSKEHSDYPEVDFEGLVAFYLRNQFPLGTLQPYLHVFYRPTLTTTDRLTGSSSSSGFGMTGQHEMTLAFIYLAASALSRGMSDPKVIPEDMSFNVSEGAVKIVADLFNGRGLNHGIERLKRWVASCKQSHEGAEDKKIADAVLSVQKMDAFKREFWEAYPRSSPLLSMCLRNGNYVIDKTASTELHDRLSKITVIDWKYPVVGDAGDDHAGGLARYMEGQLLDRMAEKAGASSKVAGGLSEMMVGAAGWLKNRRCSPENGILVSTTKHAPGSQLYRDKDFVWSSRDELGSLGLDGFYKGFPVVWRRDEREPAEDSQERSEPTREQVIAIDLSGWKEIAVRDTVITECKFGELTIRTWTDTEIQEAKASGKLEEKDEDKAKGNCPMDICLHWQLNRDKPPRTKAFEAVQNSAQSELGTS